jgi:hypothetical protein
VVTGAAVIVTGGLASNWAAGLLWGGHWAGLIVEDSSLQQAQDENEFLNYC